MDSTNSEPTKQNRPVQPKQENVLVNLALNILIPTLILTKFSGESHLGPTWGVVVALSFPIAYGIYDLRRTGKVNLFSILGVVSVMLTGGIALLKLPPEYVAIKEAMVPAVLGLAVIISLKTPFPIVRTILYNDKFIQVNKVDNALDKAGNRQKFDRSLVNATFIIAASFLLSSILNYALATYLVVSQPGTEAFNAELGRMTALSFPVIAVPSSIVLLLALYYLYRSITRLTNLSLEDIMVMPNNNDADSNKDN